MWAFYNIDGLMLQMLQKKIKKVFSRENLGVISAFIWI